METVLESAAQRLRAAGVEQPRREARLLLAHALGCRQEDLLAGTASADAASMQHFESLVTRRAAREPFAYIAGRKEFWSLDFAVGPGVLVPRPETETLVEAALKHFPDRAAKLDVLDLGTGSGCLLLAFLSERPNATGIGIDASDTALVYARRNAEALGLLSRARFLAADWAGANGQFDAIFANPPYIADGDIGRLAPEVARYEPHAALSGGADGLDAYRSLAVLIPRLLRPKGAAFVELGQGRGEAVSAIFCACGLVIVETINDLSGIHRCLVVQREAKDQAKKELAKETRSS